MARPTRLGHQEREQGMSSDIETAIQAAQKELDGCKEEFGGVRAWQTEHAHGVLQGLQEAEGIIRPLTSERDRLRGMVAALEEELANRPAGA
jgi:hypothetical protein